MISNNSSLLKIVLLSEGILAFISSIACLLFSKAIAGLFGIAAPWVITGLGVVLIAAAIKVYRSAQAKPIDTGMAKFAMYGNLAWVLGSIVVIFANIPPLTTAAKWVIAAITDIALILSIGEYIGLRKLAK